MRGKWAMVVPVALILAVAGMSSANGKSASKVRCKLVVHTQPSGYGLGLVKCGKPYGKGLIYVRSKATQKGKNVIITGPFKEYFDAGTLHGTYKLRATTSSTKIKGTATIKGGTGAFKGVSGTIHLNCAATNSTTTTCTS